MSALPLSRRRTRMYALLKEKHEIKDGTNLRTLVTEPRGLKTFSHIFCFDVRFVHRSLVCASARGDLTRLLGMRTVAFLGLVSEINSDVALSTKARVVGGICFSKAMFWDSKYHVSCLLFED